MTAHVSAYLNRRFVIRREICPTSNVEFRDTEQVTATLHDVCWLSAAAMLNADCDGYRQKTASVRSEIFACCKHHLAVECE